MANKQTIETQVKFSADIEQLTKAVNQIQAKMNDLKPAGDFGNNMRSILTDLQTEIERFTAKSQRNLSSMADARALETSGNKINDLFNRLTNQLESLSTKSNKELKKIFPENLPENIKAAVSELEKYTNQENDRKKAIDETTKAITAQERKLERLEKRREDKEKKIDHSTSREQLNREVIAAKDKKSEAEANRNAINKEINAKKKKEGLAPDQNLNLEIQENIDLMKKLEEATTAAAKAQEEFRAAQDKAKKTLTQEDYDNYFKGDYKSSLEEIKTEKERLEGVKKTLEDVDQAAPERLQRLLENLSKITSLPVFEELKEEGATFEKVKETVSNLASQGFKYLEEAVSEVAPEIEKAGNAIKNMGDKTEESSHQVKQLTETQKQLENFKNNILQFFSIGNAVQLFKRAVSSAIQTVKELDAAMTEIAVVSDFDIGDMWEKLPEFTDQANKLGVAVKDMYSATTLYIQQGLSMNDSLALSNQTMKMARIAGLEAADATDAMTAALRGFNMELNETSAQNIADVYAKLAAITAADVNEISTAMTKTASIAANANMEFETTAAFLSQIIETTRESAETAGTAMKTVIARFQELKKDPSEIGEVDGEIVDANKIETALRSIGVALRDSEGQFRDLDDVFLEIAKKWDSLDTNTQRYIATMAAGSRQQSRFIAMMSNYERTMELVGAANNSAGASQEQFEKTLESLEAKLARLKNAWDEFTTGIANNELIKFGVDVLTDLLELINKLSSGTGDFGEALIKLGLGFGAIKGGESLLKNLFAKISGSPVAKDAGAGLGAKFIKGFKGKISNTKIYSEEFNKNFLGSLFKDSSGLEASLSSALNNVDLESVNFEGLRKELDNIFNTLSEEDQNGVLELAGLKKGFDTNAESVKKYSEAIEAAGGKTSGLLQKTGGAATKIKADWQVVGIAISAAGAALSGIGRAFQNAGFEKFGKVITTVGTALMAFGTIMSVVIPLKAEIMATKVGKAIFSIPYIGWIAAIATALITATTAIIQVVDSAEEKAERLDEQINKLRESGQETLKAYEELTSNFDKYKELSKNLDGMVVGTQAWRDALIESNDAALKLLETYPELQKYVQYDSNGKISFTDDVGEFFEELKRQGVNATRGSIALGAYNSVQKLNNYDTEIEQTDEVFLARERLRQEKLGLTDAEQNLQWLIDNGGTQEQIAEAQEGIQSLIAQIEETEKEISELKAPVDQKRLKTDIEVENQVASALVEGMEDEIKESDFGFDLANTIAGGFDTSSYQEEIDKKIGELNKSAHNYKKLLMEKYGYTKEQVNNMTREQRKLTYASLLVMDDLGKGLEEFYDIIKELEPEQQKTLSRLLKGSDKYNRALTRNISSAIQNIKQNEDGSYDYSSIIQEFENLTGTSLEEAASKLGMSTEEFVEKLKLDAKMAETAFSEAEETLAKVGVDFARFDQYDLSSETLSAFADQIYSAFLDLGPEAARGLFNSFSSAIDQATPEQRDAVMAALAQVDLSSYEGIVGFTDQFETLAKSAGISSTQVEKLKGEMLAFAGVVEQIDVEKLKESAKSLEDVGKRIEKEPTNYVFSETDMQQMLDSGAASATDFVATGVHEWVYIGGSLENLLSSINTNVYGILGKMEVSSYAVERGADWKDVVNKKISMGLGEYWVTGSIESFMKNLSALSPEEIKNTYSFGDLWRLGEEAGAFINQDGSVVKKEDFKGSAAELASFLLARYNEYYGAGGLTYEINQEEYKKQLEQQAANEAQAEMIQMMNRTGQGLVTTTPGGWSAVYSDRKQYALAKAAELGVDQELINRAKRTNKKEDFLNLIDAISQKETINALTETSKKILEITKNYEDLTKIKTEDVHNLGDLLGLDTRFNTKNFKLIKDNLNDISLAMQGDAEAWDRFLDKISLTDENVANLVSQGFYTVTTKKVKKGTWFNRADYDENGNITGYSRIQSTSDSEEYQVLNRTGLDALAFATGNMEGVVETEDISLEKNFNDLQKINAEQRKRVQYEREYEKLLRSEDATAERLAENLNNRLKSLATERDIVESLYSKEEADLEAKLGKTEVAGVSLEKINGQFVIQADYEDLSDSQKEEAQDYIKELEEQIELLNDFKEQLAEIDDEVSDIANMGRDEYLGLEERLTNALTKARQEELDAMREINDSINNAATDLMDAVQSNIDKMRQDRENEKTENEIAEKERRLAYLRQDTSGANAAEIKSLEKEIAQQKEGYGDTLIDQALSDMQKQNEEAAKQREEQLQKQQEAHDLMVENGGYAKKAMGILAETLEKGNAFDKTSEFYKTLYEGEKGSVLTDTAYEKWMEDLIYSVNSASVYNNSPLPKTEVPANYDVKVDDPQIMGKMLDIYRDKGRITKDILILNELRNQKIAEHPELYDESMKILTWYDLLSQLNRKYATGGIADFTGPAWLDGTKSHPELILNARDTENFILLKDALSKAVNGGLSGSSDNGGDNYFDITIEVEEIGNDYDVDQMAARIKQQIYEDSAYRNVNTINFLR